MDRVVSRSVAWPPRPARGPHREEERSPDVTYDLRIERLIDAPPEVVFDSFVDPAAQSALYDDPSEPGWNVESELDLRVGGTWTIAFGKAGEDPYRETNVFTEVDRPRRLVFDSRMRKGDPEWRVDT